MEAAPLNVFIPASCPRGASVIRHWPMVMMLMISMMIMMIIMITMRIIMIIMMMITMMIIMIMMIKKHSGNVVRCI